MRRASKRYVLRDEIKMALERPQHLQLVKFRERGCKSYITARYNAQTHRFEHVHDESKTDGRYVAGWIPQ